MPKLDDLTCVTLSKAVAAQDLEDDSFSVTEFITANAGVYIRGEYRPPSPAKVERIAASVAVHYVAVVTGSKHVDLMRWISKNARGIMRLQYPKSGASRKE